MHMRARNEDQVYHHHRLLVVIDASRTCNRFTDIHNAEVDWVVWVRVKSKKRRSKKRKKEE
jgi:hypothetical protein